MIKFEDTLYCFSAVQSDLKRDWVITDLEVKAMHQDGPPPLLSYDGQHAVVVGELLTVETMHVPEQLPSNDDNDMHRIKQDVCDYWREQRQQEENLDRTAEAEKTAKRRRKAQQKAGPFFFV